jgi:hypothetical protein
LYGLLILQHGRRELLWMGVTAHPSAEWIACQLTEACGWRRDHTTSFATVIASTAMLFSVDCGRWAYGIGRPHHGHPGRTDAERLIGSLRRGLP